MLVEIFMILLMALLARLYYIQLKIMKSFTSKEIRVISGIPIFGTLWRSLLFRRHIVEDLDDCYKVSPRERYVIIFENITPIILIKDIDLIKRITVKDFDYFVDRRQIFDEDVDPFLSNSLVMMKGDKWRHMRATLSPAFTGAKIKQMIPFMNAVSRNVVDYLQLQTENKIDETSEVTNLDDLTRRYAVDVIASTVFGLDVNSFTDKSNNFYEVSKTLIEFTLWRKIKIFFIRSFPYVAKKLHLKIFPEQTIEFFKNILKDTISYRERNGIERSDVIQLLSQAYKGTLNFSSLENDSFKFCGVDDTKWENDATGQPWTQDELAAQGLLFFLAGFEGPASVLAIAVHELAINEDIQKKLYEEVKHSEYGKQLLTYEVIQALKYLDMVVNETLRKWSPGTFMERVCVKPYELPPATPGASPLKVEQGQIVINVVNSIHMDEMYYSKPRQFNPENFSEENKEHIQPFTFMPFGVGPRNCIGARFALLEMKVFLYHIVLNFEILKCDKTSDPLRLKPHFQIRVVGDNWVKFRKRVK